MSTEQSPEITLPSTGSETGADRIVCEVPGREPLVITFSQSHEGSVEQFCEVATDANRDISPLEAIGIGTSVAVVAFVATRGIARYRNNLHKRHIASQLP